MYAFIGANTDEVKPYSNKATINKFNVPARAINQAELIPKIHEIHMRGLGPNRSDRYPEGI
jgi:hypothetical protein